MSPPLSICPKLQFWAPFSGQCKTTGLYIIIWWVEKVIFSIFLSTWLEVGMRIGGCLFLPSTKERSFHRLDSAILFFGSNCPPLWLLFYFYDWWVIVRAKTVAFFFSKVAQCNTYPARREHETTSFMQKRAWFINIKVARRPGNP